MNKLYSQIKTAGFTIVELIVVIVVLGILATIAVASYRTTQDKTSFATIDTDMKSLKSSLEKYYYKNAGYPTTAGVWKYSARDGNAFIPGLAPDYYSGDLPDVKTGSKTSNTVNTYSYQSNGTDYKLIRIAAGATTLPVEAAGITSSMVDSVRPANAWGYWSPGGSGW